MREQAVPSDDRVATGRRAVPIAPVGYEQFRQMAWTACQQIQGGNPQGVTPIAELRRVLRHVPSSSFNQHLVRLERNGLVYLIPPEDPNALTEDERQQALAHPAGDVRAFLLWMGPKTQPAYFWD